jgi:hypothetical protein
MTGDVAISAYLHTVQPANQPGALIYFYCGLQDCCVSDEAAHGTLVVLQSVNYFGGAPTNGWVYEAVACGDARW